MSMREAAEYIAIKVLAGREELLRAMLDYALGESPRELRDRYGVSRGTMSSFIARMKAKACVMHVEPVIRLLVPAALRKLDRAVALNGSCMACRRKLPPYRSAEDHIAKRHRELVAALARELLEEVKRNAAEGHIAEAGSRAA